MESRIIAAPRIIQPSLAPASVFEIIAGISGGGATVVGPDPEATAPGDGDLVVFTSGTTGPPKGVRLTELNLTAAASASADHLGHGSEDAWLLAMPLHHVGGLSIIVRQVGNRFHPGDNVGKGGDDTLFATANGTVKYGARKGRKHVSVLTEG